MMTVLVMPSNWRDGFGIACMQADRKREGPGLMWRETGPDYWSGFLGSQSRGTVMLESATARRVADLRREDPSASPVTTVGRFDTVEAAQVAIDQG